MSKEPLIGQASEEQIAAWKKQYGAVYIVTVEGHVCYLRKPDRKIIAYASTVLKDSPFQYVEEIFNNCRIGGSELFDTDDDYFLAAMQTVNELVQLKTAEIVKA
ncbi:MAG TPA: hypothetical protein PLQ78_09675 [Flavipsychrobacter sp.]|nr:hypothetical protein [Flavipsychrobacter sp.]